ncbi:MAG: SIR2 family NAD-dependent protein deacylase [Planctomycetota bacterium]|jgi:NAD-dependent deacetylase
MSAPLDQAYAILSGVDSVVVLTGAGMSRDSGVPTFRDALTGLWERFDPHELATEAAFRKDPARVFGWYMWRWRLVRQARTHAGYTALARLATLGPSVTVVTQNVDGLHHREGDLEVVELHGSLAAFRCLDGGHPYPAERLEHLSGSEPAEVPPPACPLCGSPIRPGVVWFGEVLPEAAVERAWHVVSQCDALIVVGTSSLVYPAAILPQVAIGRGCPVIEMNPDITPLSPHVTVRLPERAEVALPMLTGRLAGAT